MCCGLIVGLKNQEVASKQGHAKQAQHKKIMVLVLQYMVPSAVVGEKVSSINQTLSLFDFCINLMFAPKLDEPGCKCRLFERPVKLFN